MFVNFPLAMARQKALAKLAVAQDSLGSLVESLPNRAMTECET